MSDLLAARAQMGTSLAFHIIFSALGVGLPLLLCIAEGLALKTKNPVWMMLTRRWARAAAILFAIGAVSGTILSFELGLLWPTYTRFAGAVVGLPFMLEGFAFFTEAIFLGLYLYGWDKLSPRAHWLCSFPIWISGMASAWFIVSANSWMNTPAGFIVKNGQITGINPFQAIFNPSTPYETVHMILACYVASGFAVAAIYAFAYLRGKRTEYVRKGIMVGMLMAVGASPLQIVSGDFNARFLAEYQPAKFAAMEGVIKTQAGVPIKIGGLVNSNTGEIQYAIEIPNGLSFLAYDNFHAVIHGLDQVPREDWPYVSILCPVRSASILGNVLVQEAYISAESSPAFRCNRGGTAGFPGNRTGLDGNGDWPSTLGDIWLLTNKGCGDNRAFLKYQFLNIHRDLHFTGGCVNLAPAEGCTQAIAASKIGRARRRV